MGNRWLKHAFDRVASACVAPVFVPPFCAIAAAIKVEDLLRGQGTSSVFYRETRFSANQEFKVMKFRVLQHSAWEQIKDDNVVSIKRFEHNPEAVSTVGKFLVKYYLDELPQIFHVVAGRMSLVGPRPVLPNDHERLAYFAPYQIKAGLAGTFQFAKGEGDIFDLDKIYLERYGAASNLELLRYDIEILLKTLRKMTLGEGL